MVLVALLTFILSHIIAVHFTSICDLLKFPTTANKQSKFGQKYM